MIDYCQVHQREYYRWWLYYIHLYRYDRLLPDSSKRLLQMMVMLYIHIYTRPLPGCWLALDHNAAGTTPPYRVLPAVSAPIVLPPYPNRTPCNRKPASPPATCRVHKRSVTYRYCVLGLTRIPPLRYSSEDTEQQSRSTVRPAFRKNDRAPWKVSGPPLRIAG